MLCSLLGSTDWEETLRFMDYLDKSTVLLEWLQVSAGSSFAGLTVITVISGFWF